MNFKIYLIVLCGIFEAKFFGGSLVYGQSCGRVQIGRGNTIGGQYALHGAFPWIAVLMNNEGKPFCGGTLLTKNKVLTAAHCTQGKDDQYEFLPRDITVTLGAHNLSVAHERGKLAVGVQSIENHRDWNTKSASFDADISMLTLTDNVAFSRYIQPICLIDPNSEVARVSKGFSGGYGKSEKDENNENVFKSVEIPIASNNEECFYTNDILLKISSPRTFCGGSRGGAGVCLGDSGNGLFVKKGETYYLRGIVSASLYTDFNCDVHNYAIFTNVLNFNSWIVERIDRGDGELILRRAPSITPFESPITAVEGTNFELACKANGVPSPSITWKRIGTVEDNASAKGNVLQISSVRNANSGGYRCEAVNSEGSTSSSVVLVTKPASTTTTKAPTTTTSRIVIQRRAPSITPFESPITVVEGANFELACKADGVPSPSISWKRMPPIEENVSAKGNVLQITNVDHSNSGEYTCEADNSEGSASSSVVLIFTPRETSGHVPWTPRAISSEESDNSYFRNFSGPGETSYDTGYVTSADGTTTYRKKFYSKCVGNGCPP